MANIQSEPLWRWRELCEALDLNPEDGPDVVGISIDSRTIQQGDLFVALSGNARPKFNIFESSGRDGHEFIESALTLGAIGALTHLPTSPKIPYLQVGETLEGLWQLAGFRRNSLNCPVIALTGSSGKTTLKSFLCEAFGQPPSHDSLNNDIGVPLSMVRTPKDAEIAIYEVGTNHPGEISLLSNLVQPSVSVVLNVANAHIGNFDSLRELQEEKLAIGEGLVDEGVLVVPFELFSEARKRYPKIRVLSFGSDSGADVNYAVNESESNVTINSPQEEITIGIPGGGLGRAETLAAAATVLYSLEERLDRLANVSDNLPPGRGRSFIAGGIRIVDESYNANPSSMRVCLRQLIGAQEGRRVAIVGQMNELGDRSHSLHASLVPLLNQLDGVMGVGDDVRDFVVPHLRSDVCWGMFENTEDLLSFCTVKLEPSDNVLVKGSNTVFWKHRFVEKLTETLTS